MRLIFFIKNFFIIYKYKLNRASSTYKNANVSIIFYIIIAQFPSDASAFCVKSL